MVLVTTLSLVAYGQQLLMLVGGIDLSVGPLMGMIGVVGSFFLQQDAGTGMQLVGFAAILALALGVGLLTHAVRTAIQRSQASPAQRSKELGINPKTVAKWRKRARVKDMKTGPTEPRSTVLTEARRPRSIAESFRAPIAVGRLTDPCLATDLGRQRTFFALLDERHLRVRKFYRFRPIPLFSQP